MSGMLHFYPTNSPSFSVRPRMVDQLPTAPLDRLLDGSTSMGNLGEFNGNPHGNLFDALICFMRNHRQNKTRKFEKRKITDK